MKTRAIAQNVRQIGPDSWESAPAVVDVPDDMTMGELREKIRARLGLHQKASLSEPGTELVFTVILSDE